jgi:hypothetical protein
VIELPHPHPHDARVIGVRMAIDPPTKQPPRYATIFVDVEFLPPDELIDRAGF